MNGIINWLFCRAEVEPDLDVSGYIAAKEKVCYLCVEEFQKSDFLARTILKTDCCPIYVHKDCLKQYVKEGRVQCLVHRESKYDFTSCQKRWDAYLERAHKLVLTELGMRDHEIAQELAAKELEEEAARRKQEQDDANLARHLQSLDPN